MGWVPPVDTNIVLGTRLLNGTRLQKTPSGNLAQTFITPQRNLRSLSSYFKICLDRKFFSFVVADAINHNKPPQTYGCHCQSIRLLDKVCLSYLQVSTFKSRKVNTFKSCRINSFKSCRVSTFKSCRISAFKSCRVNAAKSCRMNTIRSCRANAFESCRVREGG